MKVKEHFADITRKYKKNMFFAQRFASDKRPNCEEALPYTRSISIGGSGDFHS